MTDEHSQIEEEVGIIYDWRWDFIARICLMLWVVSFSGIVGTITLYYQKEIDPVEPLLWFAAVGAASGAMNRVLDYLTWRKG